MDYFNQTPLVCMETAAHTISLTALMLRKYRQRVKLFVPVVWGSPVTVTVFTESEYTLVIEPYS